MLGLPVRQLFFNMIPVAGAVHGADCGICAGSGA